MKRLYLSLAILLIAICCPAQQHAPQRVVTDTIYSEVLKAKRAYTVILPVSFESNKNKKYPVLYLLHGMYGKNDDWLIQGRVMDVYDKLVNSGEACEMVIISPDAGGGDPEKYQNGYYDMEGWKYETFFFSEFMPCVEKRFRVIADKQHRAVSGLSMGGGGSVGYGQHHPDKFCAVYAMSALMNIPKVGEAKTDNPHGKLARLTKSVIENNCIEYVTKADEQRKAALCSVSWFVDCGDDDFLLDCNIEFYQAMWSARIPCQLRVRDGVHNWEYWYSALYQCLPFVSRNFK